jgi:hypothetical protein
MTIFLVLNGMALVFMLYVLVNFWIEGKHTARTGFGSQRMQSPYEARSGVYLVTRRLDLATLRPDKSSVIRFPSAKNPTQMAGAMSSQGDGKTSLWKSSSG